MGNTQNKLEKNEESKHPNPNQIQRIKKIRFQKKIKNSPNKPVFSTTSPLSETYSLEGDTHIIPDIKTPPLSINSLIKLQEGRTSSPKIIKRIPEIFQNNFRIYKTNLFARKSILKLVKNLELNSPKSSNKVYLFDNDLVYIGELYNGKLKHGFGICIYRNGAVFEGEFFYNLFENEGIFYDRNGSFYYGNWTRGKLTGKGVYNGRRGEIYKGDFNENFQHGKGVENWPDGTVFEGSYFEGKKHGFGKFISKDGDVYEGDFKDDKITGKGCFEYSNGNSYEGEFYENKKHGFGVFNWQDGRVYEGNFKENLKSGYGVFNWPNGLCYKGNWENGIQEGKCQVLKNGVLLYDGEWQGYNGE